MPRTLVRDDLHQYVAALGVMIAIMRQSSGIVYVYLPCFCISQLSWWVLHRHDLDYQSEAERKFIRPTKGLVRRGPDTTVIIQN